MLDAILERVDARTSQALGVFFQQLGLRLLGIASAAEQAEASNGRRRRRNAEVRKSAEAIEEMMAGGLSLEAAIEQVALRLDVEIEQVGAAYKLAGRRGKRRSQLTRNVRIMRLAGAGMTSKEIAPKVGLSADRVDRIIKQMIAAGRDIESLGQRYRQLRSNHRPPANTDAAVAAEAPPLAGTG